MTNAYLKAAEVIARVGGGSVVGPGAPTLDEDQQLGLRRLVAISLGNATQGTVGTTADGLDYLTELSTLISGGRTGEWNQLISFLLQPGDLPSGGQPVSGAVRGELLDDATTVVNDEITGWVSGWDDGAPDFVAKTMAPSFSSWIIAKGWPMPSDGRVPLLFLALYLGEWYQPSGA